MESKKDSTRMLLGKSLQTLMQKHPFEKITIKMITDEAGFIRPTFYHYFQDKYELLEWIFMTDIIEKVRSPLEAGMVQESLRLFFLLIEKDKDFYKKALSISGQNSFKDMMTQHIYEIFLSRIILRKLNEAPGIRLLTPEIVALYYSKGITDAVEAWLLQGSSRISADEVSESYFYMLSHSIFDILK